MRTLAAIWALALLSIPVGVRAQPHARRAEVHSVAGQAPGVLIESDLVWSPIVVGTPVSACGPNGCRRIVSFTHCNVPECPGSGTLFAVEDDLAELDDFPDGLEEFQREQQALRQDPSLAELIQFYSEHPDQNPEPTDWEVRPAVSAGGSLGSTGDAEPFWGLTGSLGISFQLDVGEILNHDGDHLFETVIGDRFTIEVRGHIWVDGGYDQFSDPTYAVGVGIMAENDLRHVSRFNVPSIIGVVLPELGVFVRGNTPSFYAAVSAPARLFMSEEFGVELRVSAFMVSDFGNGEPDTMVTLALKAVSR